MTTTTIMSASTTNQKLWSCSDLDCTSEQTSLPRSQAGRKVVSDYFGRNKTATKAIPDDVWHWQCRKGYQKAKYAAERAGSESLGLFYSRHLRQQLVRIKLWRPESTFVVQLCQPAKGRLSTYHDSLRRSGGDETAALAAITVPARVGRSEKALLPAPSDAVAPAHAEHIDTHFAGKKRSVDFIIDRVLTWVDGEFKNGSMVQMPPVEFLINDPGEDDTINDPGANFQQWLDHQATMAPAGESAASSRKRRADDHDDDDDSKKPRKVPRLKALHGPRRPKPLDSPKRDDTAKTTPPRYTAGEYDAATALLMLGQQTPTAPYKKITIASLLNTTSLPLGADPSPSKPRPARRETRPAPAPLPFWVPPLHQQAHSTGTITSSTSINRNSFLLKILTTPTTPSTYRAISPGHIVQSIEHDDDMIINAIISENADAEAAIGSSTNSCRY